MAYFYELSDCAKKFQPKIENTLILWKIKSPRSRVLPRIVSWTCVSGLQGSYSSTFIPSSGLRLSSFDGNSPSHFTVEAFVRLPCGFRMCHFLKHWNKKWFLLQNKSVLFLCDSPTGSIILEDLSLSQRCFTRRCNKEASLGNSGPLCSCNSGKTNIVKSTASLTNFLTCYDSPGRSSFGGQLHLLGYPAWLSAPVTSLLCIAQPGRVCLYFLNSFKRAMFSFLLWPSISLFVSLPNPHFHPPIDNNCCGESKLHCNKFQFTKPTCMKWHCRRVLSMDLASVLGQLVISDGPPSSGVISVLSVPVL